MPKPKYEIAMSEHTLDAINEYRQNLISGKEQPGAFLQTKLAESGKSIKDLKTAEFIEVMLSTKQPKFFAESAIKGGGRDWNNSELKILGDINVTVPVKIHDNGVWNPNDKGFKVHDKPLNGELLFTPGALLKSGAQFSGKTPDLAEVTKDGKIDQEAYNKLVERRLLPLLVHANEQAKKDGKPAVITMPGVGAGEFAGEFKGKMGEHLNQAMQAMLEKHGANLKNIAAIHYDSFAECNNQQKNFGNLQYRVRPSLKEGNEGKKQLSDPSDLEDKDKKGEFKNCKIYKVVAWDHVSLPGNDYFVGARHTDDGVAAAATNSMYAITGVKGVYDAKTGRYNPPEAPKGEKPYRNWEDVANRNGIHLIAKDNIKIISNEAKSYSLAEFEKKQQSVSKQQPQIQPVKPAAAPLQQPTQQAANPIQNAVSAPDRVVIYSARDTGGDGTRVALRFSSQQERDKFVNHMVKEAATENIDLKDVFNRTHSGNPQVLYINASKGPGTVGTYVSANQELAVNLGNDSVTKKFRSALNLEAHHAYQPLQSNALYFYRETLPPVADGQTNLATKSNYVDTTSIQQPQIQPIKPATVQQQQSSQQAANSIQNAVSAPDRVVIYSARDTGGDGTRVALRFSSQQERDKFVNHMVKEAATENIDLKDVFNRTHSGNPQVLYINASKGPGTVGTYVSANQELAVNLGNDSVTKKFRSALNLEAHHAYQPLQSNALYFYRETLPPVADGQTNLATKSNYVDTIPIQQPAQQPAKPVVQPAPVTEVKPQQPKAVDASPVVIYCAQTSLASRPRVALSFSSPEERSKFIESMINEGNAKGTDLSKVFDPHNKNPQVLYINASSNATKGVGTYVTDDGKLSVSLGHPDVMKKFQSTLNLDESQGYASEKRSTFYFKPEILPPVTNKDKNIKTKVTYAESIQPAQVQQAVATPKADVQPPKPLPEKPVTPIVPKQPVVTAQVGAPQQPSLPEAKPVAPPPNPPLPEKPVTPSVLEQPVVTPKVDAQQQQSPQVAKPVTPPKSQELPEIPLQLENNKQKSNIIIRAYNAVKDFINDTVAKITGNTKSMKEVNHPSEKNNSPQPKTSHVNHHEGKVNMEAIVSKNQINVKEHLVSGKGATEHSPINKPQVKGSEIKR